MVTLDSGDVAFRRKARERDQKVQWQCYYFAITINIGRLILFVCWVDDRHKQRRLYIDGAMKPEDI